MASSLLTEGCPWCGGPSKIPGYWCSDKCFSEEDASKESGKAQTTTQVIRHEEVTEDVLLAQAKVAEEREKRLQREAEIKAEQHREAAIETNKKREDYIPDNTDEFKTLFLAAKQVFESGKEIGKKPRDLTSMFTEDALTPIQLKEKYLARMKALSDAFKLNLMSDPNYDRMVQFFNGAIDEAETGLAHERKKDKMGTVYAILALVALCGGGVILHILGIIDLSN